MKLKNHTHIHTKQQRKEHGVLRLWVGLSSALKPLFWLYTDVAGLVYITSDLALICSPSGAVREDTQFERRVSLYSSGWSETHYKPDWLELGGKSSSVSQGPGLQFPATRLHLTKKLFCISGSESEISSMWPLISAFKSIQKKAFPNWTRWQHMPGIPALETAVRGSPTVPGHCGLNTVNLFQGGWRDEV